MLERRIARLLTLGTYASVALLAVGVAATALTGRSPRESSPPLDIGRLPGDLLSLRPDGFLWLGLVLLIGTPTARVITSLVGYVGRRELRMAAISVAILGIIALSVILGLAAEG